MDILLKRYGSIEYLMEMDFMFGHEVVVKALQKEQDERAWEMYLSIYPNMSEKSYMSFEQFKEKAKKGKGAKTDASDLTKKPDTRSTADIISMAERIKQADMKQRQAQ